MTENLAGVETVPELPKGKDSLDYVSKSRIKTFLQCPRQFYWKYWCEERPPGSIYTERGSQVHKAFEEFHENLLNYIEQNKKWPNRFTPLLEDWRDYGQWVEMIGEFFRFELRRFEEAQRSLVGEFAHNPEERLLNRWKPIGVEVELWVGQPPDSWDRGNPAERFVADADPPVGDIPWMGFADLIVDTRSVPEVEGNGVVIIDYKTGTAPTIKYEGKPWLEENLNEGIFLEGEYYGWLAENIPSFDHEVDAVAGYYPKNDEFIVSPYPDDDRRRDIKRAVLGMQSAPEIANFDTEESPLCHYNNSENHGQCFFYPVCPVQRDCAECDPSPTSGNGRYD